MVVYNCNICDKKFYKKGDYARHLNRKYPCDKIDSNNNANGKNMSFFSKMDKNLSKMENDDHPSYTYPFGNVENVENNADKVHKCAFCQTVYSTKGNLQKHKKNCKTKIIKGEKTKRDKVKKNGIENNEKNEELSNFSTLDKNLSIFEKDNQTVCSLSTNNDEKCKKNGRKNHKCPFCKTIYSTKGNLKKHIKKCKVELIKQTLKDKNDNNNKDGTENRGSVYLLKQEIEELKKLCENLVQNKDSIPGNTTTNTNTNTVTNTDSNNTSNTNNIVINNFGSEDLSYITEGDYKRILGTGFKSVYYLVKYIHFNEKKPENHNIYISNQRSGLADVLESGKWMKKKKDAFLEELYYDKFTKLESKFGDLQNSLDETDRKKFAKFSDQYDGDEILARTKEEIGLLMYNNKDMPKKLIKRNKKG